MHAPLLEPGNEVGSRGITSASGVDEDQINVIVQALWSGPGDLVTLRQVRAGLAKCSPGIGLSRLKKCGHQMKSEQLTVARFVRTFTTSKMSELIKPKSVCTGTFPLCTAIVDGTIIPCRWRNTTARPRRALKCLPTLPPHSLFVSHKAGWQTLPPHGLFVSHRAGWQTLPPHGLFVSHRAGWQTLPPHSLDWK
jgi:hypothetical protein